MEQQNDILYLTAPNYRKFTCGMRGGIHPPPRPPARHGEREKERWLKGGYIGGGLKREIKREREI